MIRMIILMMILMTAHFLKSAGVVLFAFTSMRGASRSFGGRGSVFDMGIPRVGFCHTVTKPLDTIPIQGMGRNRPLIYTVSYETQGITFTWGILIIKFVKLI